MSFNSAVIAEIRKRIDEERQGSIRAMLGGLPHEKYLFSCGFVHCLQVIEDAIPEIIEQMKRS